MLFDNYLKQVPHNNIKVNVNKTPINPPRTYAQTATSFIHVRILAKAFKNSTDTEYYSKIKLIDFLVIYNQIRKQSQTYLSLNIFGKVFFGLGGIT